MASSNQQIQRALMQALESHSGVLETFADGTIADANDIFLQFFGYTADELIGRHHRVLCPPEHAASEEYALFWQQIRSGTINSGRYQRKHKNGRTVWLKAIYSPVFNDEGEVKRCVVICTDITAHMERRHGKQAHLAALDKALLIVEYTLSAGLVECNDNFLATFGYGKEQVLGKSIKDFLAPGSAETAGGAAIWKKITAGHHYSGVLECKAANGSLLWLDGVFLPVPDLHGKIKTVLHFATDITYQRQQKDREQEQTHILSLVAGKTGNAVFIADSTRKIIFINDAFTRAFGYSSGDITGKTPAAIYGPSDSDILANGLPLLQQGKPFRTDVLTYGRDGQRFWHALMANPVMDEQGQMVYTVSVLTDITDAKMYEVLHHKALEAMVHDVSMPAVLNIICSEVESILPDTRLAIIGMAEDEGLIPLACPSMPEEYIDVFTKSSANDLYKMPSGRSMIEGASIAVPDIRLDSFWSTPMDDVLTRMDIRSCWSTPIKDSLGKVIGAVTFYHRDKRSPDPFQERMGKLVVHLCSLALERSHIRTAMRRIAFYDKLTDLPNRSLLQAKAEQALLRAQRLGQPMALFHLGLDRFKRVNDSLGHDAGDKLLKVIAERLYESYPSPNIVGRLTGDEFSIVIPDCDAIHAAAIAEKIQNQVGAPYLIDDISLIPTTCIGISLFPDNASDIESLLHKADMAMRQAKSFGRSQYSFFSQYQNKIAKERLSIESQLRGALKNKELRLAYQPKVNMRDNSLHGVEALIRWNNPKLGEVPPIKFIPLAEESGLIEEIGYWTLIEACRQLGDWRKRGIAIPSVAVNLSPTNFQSSQLLDILHRCLSDNALEPNDLILELTENVLLSNNAATLSNIFRAHELGVTFSMDDFGTGYSSLSYLRRLPITELKLDRSFVHDIDRDDTSLRLSKAVSRIGESLRLVVVAEGVENERQYNLLRTNKFHVAQGYLLAPPLPPQRLEQWYHHSVSNGKKEMSAAQMTFQQQSAVNRAENQAKVLLPEGTGA